MTFLVLAVVHAWNRLGINGGLKIFVD